VRLIIATLTTLGLLLVSDLVRNAIPFPAPDSGLEQAFSAITAAVCATVGGYIGGRWFIPIAGCIILGLFIVVGHLLVQISAVAEPTTLSTMLLQNWHRAIAPLAAAMLGAWVGCVLAAHRSQPVGNEIYLCDAAVGFSRHAACRDRARRV
jgi:hypothetical protein